MRKFRQKNKKRKTQRRKILKSINHHHLHLLILITNPEAANHKAAAKVDLAADQIQVPPNPANAQEVVQKIRKDQRVNPAVVKMKRKLKNNLINNNKF